MKFCRRCLKTLSVFDDSNTDFCKQCSPAPEKHPPTKENNKERLNGLSKAQLSVKDGKIVLLSPEGWLLWSGDISTTHSLDTIAEKAGRILDIRKRRKK